MAIYVASWHRNTFSHPSRYWYPIPIEWITASMREYRQEFEGRANFEVFDFPSFAIQILFLPSLVFWNGEEGDLLLGFGNLRLIRSSQRHLFDCLLGRAGTYFDNWRDEFNKELRELHEGRIKIIEEINDKSFDVRSIVILHFFVPS